MTDVTPPQPTHRGSSSLPPCFGAELRDVFRSRSGAPLISRQLSVPCALVLLVPFTAFLFGCLKTNTVCTLAMFQPFVKHTRRLIRGIPAYSLLFSRGEQGHASFTKSASATAEAHSGRAGGGESSRGWKKVRSCVPDAWIYSPRLKRNAYSPRSSSIRSKESAAAVASWSHLSFCGCPLWPFTQI